MIFESTAFEDFACLGKPEPLRYRLKGSRSRRIDDVNRLVYKVTDEAIIIESCKYHYGRCVFRRDEDYPILTLAYCFS